MTAIPQLGPEVFIDDTDDITKQAKSTVSPMLSPNDIADPRSSFITHGLDGAARHRRKSSVGPLSPAAAGAAPGSSTGVSPAASPRLSPHMPTNSANSNFSFEGGEQPGGGLTPPGSGQSSRRGSAVSAENVLDVLDNSAWGESIRRSFTVKRPGDRSDGRPGRGGSVS